MHPEKGDVSGFVLVIALIAAIFLIAFFHSDRAFFDSTPFKAILRLPCGLSVKHPDPSGSTKLVFPFTVDGYANGCGWGMANGSAGTVQIFDGKGLPLTAPVPLSVSSDQTGSPFYFETSLSLIAPPSTDKGNMLFTSTSGLVQGVSVNF